MITAEQLLDNTSHMDWLNKSQKMLVEAIMETYKELALEEVKNNAPLHSVSGCFYIFEEMDSNAEFGCIADSIEEAKEKLVSKLQLDIKNLGYKCSHELI